jgi:hypothetical protein
VRQKRVRLGDIPRRKALIARFLLTSGVSPCRSPEQSSIFLSLFVSGQPGVAVKKISRLILKI